jgi:hypothetical protein
MAGTHMAEHIMTARKHLPMGRSAITAVAVALFTAAVLGQGNPPPIPGATGEVIPEKSGDGATTAIVEGTKHVVGAVKSAFGGKNGDKRTEGPTLDGLQLGTKVVVRTENPSAKSVSGNDQDRAAEPKETEGTVIDIDHRTNVIVIRLAADRTTEKLKLVASAADRDKSATADAGDTVTVSYVDTNGEKVVQTFRIVS